MRQEKSGSFYNEDRKKEFLYDYAGEKDEKGNLILDESGNFVIKNQADYTRCRAVLRRIAVFEFRYGKDFCELQNGVDKDFLNSIYSELFSNLSEYTSKVYHIILRKYVMWCHDKNYISSVQCYDHPFYISRITGWKTRTSDDFRSMRTKKQIECLQENIEESQNENYIFKSENEFFEYVEELFGSTEYIMDAAICCLLYYGFEMKDIRTIKRTDVNDRTHTVCGVKIENTDAFKLIKKAKHASSYVALCDTLTVNRCYVDGPYLIRSHRIESVDNPISMTYMWKLLDREEKAAKRDRVSLKYRGIRIKPVLISKLRVFYKAVSDKEEYGLDYVLEKFRTRQYKPLKYREFQSMLLKCGE